jgi:thioredoxin-disulfide reductase
MEGFNWQQGLIGLFLVYFVATKVFGFGGGLPFGEHYGQGHADYVPGDQSYLKGKVIEVATHEQFTQLLSNLKLTSGLPVVLDFYSPTCGPCVMIAPAFQQLAKEYAKRAVFVKVNVNANGETSSVYQVRSMPTFLFILNEKVIHRFSGADSGRLRQLTEAVVSMAENHGTYVDKEITAATLTAFYKEHDPSKVPQVEEILAKHGDKTALLMGTLKHKYGKGPEAVPRVEKKKPTNSSKPAAAAETSEPLNPTSEVETEKEQAEELAVELFVSPPYTTRTGNLANPEKVVIIGGGPAGLSAAIYAARAGLSPFMIAPMFGGQLLGKGVDVENFPGVVGKQSTGQGLVSIMRLQAHGFNTRLANDAVLGLDTSSRPFRLFLNESKEAVYTHSIIFATGADSKWLGIPGEHEYRGHGVSSCATCDGFLFKGQHVVVIGGGDAAMEDALVLARTSASVTIVHRKEHFRASRILSERVKAHPKIRILWQHVASSFEGVGTEEADKKLTKVIVAHTVSGKQQTLGAHAAFVAIGHSPNTGLLKGLLDMDEQGYLFTQSHSTRTSVDGIFAAGDVADKVYRQAVTSAGTGAAASLDAERWLSEHGLGIS